MRWLKGYIHCRVYSGHWERFMNLCRHHGIKLWNIRTEEDRVDFCMFARDYKLLKAFVGKTGVVPHICGRGGAVFVWERAMRNWTFTLGLVLFFAVLKVLSLFVWQINYYGQREYTEETVSKEVTSMGVYEGMLRSNLNCDRIERNLREIYDNMSWVSAEEKGCVLNIKIKEGTSTKGREEALAKEEAGGGTPCHVIAPCGGTVQSIVTKEGTAAVARGAKVKKGDVLIRGIVEIMDDSGAVIRKNGVHADGQVTILTEKKYKDSIKIRHTAKNKTGKDLRVFTIQWNGTRFSLKNPLKWFDNSANYDIINNICVDREFIPLHMSVKVTERTYIAYRKEEASYTDKEAEDILKKRFQSRLASYEERGYGITDHTFEITKEQDAFLARGKVVMSISDMKERAVAKEEIMLDQSGEEDDNGTGADNN